MKKKTAIALAVGAIGAVSAMPALAQVEIYGRLYPQLTSVEATGATDPAANEKRRLSIDTSNSRVGFRGTEKVGGGMAAIWQIETRTRFDSGVGGVWANSRDSFVGLSGGWGTVKFGNFDTIYKTYGAAVGNFFGAGSGNFVSSSNVLSELGIAPGGGEDGVGRAGQGNASGFHIRASNTISYETPEFGGFQGGAQFSPDERKGNPGRLPTRGGDVNASLWSFGVKYEAGPIYAALAHERHNDWFDLSTNVAAATAAFPGITTTTDSRDRAWRASGKFAVTPQHRITGDLSRLEWKESGGAISGDYKRTSWAAGWEASWGGPWRTEITYTRANAGSCSVSVGTCSTEGLDGKQIAAGVGYSLSKRTTLYGIAAKLTNGENAAFNGTANLDVNNGADTKQFALGMVHSF
jgi:predicted porin